MAESAKSEMLLTIFHMHRQTIERLGRIRDRVSPDLRLPSGLAEHEKSAAAGVLALPHMSCHRPRSDHAGANRRQGVHHA